MGLSAKERGGGNGDYEGDVGSCQIGVKERSSIVSKKKVRPEEN